MRKQLTSIAIIGGAALAACFGEGPVPEQSKAQIVFVAPVVGHNSSCGSDQYISSVQLGQSQGFAALLQYTPPNSSCGPTGTSSASIVQFDKGGTNPTGTMIGPGGMQQGFGPPIATAGSSDDAFWMVGNDLDSASAMQSIPFQNGFNASSLQATPTIVFMLGTTQNSAMSTGTGGSTEPWKPAWPANGTGGNGGGQPGELASLALPVTGGMTVLGTPSPFCDEVKTCLVQNASELYYVRHDNNGSGFAAIDRVVKPAGPISTLDGIPAGTLAGPVPVGLAATESHVAWAVANSGQSLFDGLIQPGCMIYARTLADTAAKQILATDHFSCLDVALDDEAVYFTIVAGSPPDDCNGCGGPIHGIGIGRISLDGQTFNSINVQMQGSFDGPRRVFLDDTTLYLVDPLAIAKIQTSDLDGHVDIAQ